MKKKILCSLILLGTLTLNVNAKEINTSDIEPRTYVIGTHEFSGNTTLTTEHIMLASKTIEGNTLNDMKIYYKNPRGNWINGLTGESIEVPEKLNIEYIDTIKFLQTPELSRDLDNKNGATLSIAASGYYGKGEEALKEISGWELYEKTNDGYVKITEGTDYGYTSQDFKPGETKTYVARVYKLNSSLDRVYSDYSNEITVTREKLVVPTISHDLSDLSGAHLSIQTDGYYARGDEALKEISGWELYEKTESGYAKLTDDKNYYFNVKMDGGTSKTFVARVYLEIDNEKIYSDYSEELIVTIEKIKTPTLDIIAGDETMTRLSIESTGVYENETERNKLTGWELYEKTSDGDKLISDNNEFSYELPNEYGTTKKLYARVYIIDTYDNKVYSDYSEELTLDMPLVIPTLTADDSYEAGARLTIISEGDYKPESDLLKSISGWELYEKTESGYAKITEGTTYTYDLDLNEGDKRTFVARVYLDKENETRIYSDYSSPITVRKSKLGDANGDGEITIEDANLIRKYINDLSLEIDIIASDVNEDHVVTAVDADIIEKYISGEITSLPYDSGDSYTIKYDLDGGINDDANQDIYAEISLPITLKEPTKEGYTFTGWTDSVSEIPDKDITIPKGTAKNLTFKANWTINE